MTEFKGSVTERNLMKAFIDEAVDSFKYSLYATIAKSEGYHYIPSVYEEIAKNEEEHAKIWYKWLQGGEFPVTINNLKETFKAEDNSHKKIYPKYAKIAHEEGFDHIAGLFEKIAEIEKGHADKFNYIIEALNNGIIKPNEKGNYTWECVNCGIAMEQQDRPQDCPLCKSEDTFFFKRDPK